MASGRLGKRNFMQDKRRDKAFFIPNSYRRNGEFHPSEILEISSDEPTILGVYGTEAYTVFSSKALSRVEPKKGVLSRNQLGYLQSRTPVLGGLRLGMNHIITIAYPTKPARELNLSDLILVRAQIFMPYFGEGSNEPMADGANLLFGSESKYLYTRAEVLDRPHDPEGNLSIEHYEKLTELYPERVEQTGCNLEESLVDWMNGQERLTSLNLFVAW